MFKMCSFIQYLYLLLCLLIVFQIAISQRIPTFRDDYTYDAEEDAFFKEHIIRRKWGGAISICRGEGSRLAIPLSMRDHETLRSYITGPSIWIESSIRKLANKGKFNSTDESFVNWDIGEPKSYDEFHCVQMTKQGFLKVEKCDSLAGYICRKDYNSACENGDRAYVYISMADRCYKFHKIPKDWNSARKTCIDENAHLVVINSNREAEILVNLTNHYPETSINGNFDKGALHIGYKFSQGNFRTIDGYTLDNAGYENWAPGQPEMQNEEICGSMLRTGELSKVLCSQRRLFICEKHLERNLPL